MSAYDESRPAVEAQGALIAVDGQGRITLWTEAAESLLGYSPSHVLGRHLNDLLPAPAFLGALRTEGEWVGTLEVVLASGKKRSLSAHTCKATATVPCHGLRIVHLAPVSAVHHDDETDQALLRWLFDRAPVALSVYDADLRLLRQNAAMTRVIGVPEVERRGMRPSQLLPGSAGVEWEEELRQAVERGSEVPDREVPAHVVAASERDRVYLTSASPLFTASGRTIGICAAVSDISERQRARERLVLLNEASTTIGSTLDVLTTAHELADVLCPRLADWANIDLLESMLHGEEPGPFTGRVALSRAAFKSFRKGAPETTRQLGEIVFYPAHSPPVRSMAEVRSVVLATADKATRAWLAEDPERAARFRKYRWHSVLVVPIAARGAILGVAILLKKEPDIFTDEDRLLAEELVSRAAVCLDNARRYTRERAAALTLQRSLLPRTLPRQAAVEIASRYLPSDTRSGIGGDWFDAIPLSGQRVALVVGDVVGHGINAAATMGRLRTAVRTLADVDLPPEELLTHLDDVLTRLREENENPDQSGDLGATCIYAVYDPTSQLCSIACAGHPPPAMVQPDGTATFLDIPIGPPLGIGGLPFECGELSLTEGTLLAFYSDGVLNMRGRDIDHALEELRESLLTPMPSLEGLCDEVLRRLLPARPADDAALLLARTHVLNPDQVAVLDVPVEGAFVSSARSWALQRLEDWGLAEFGFVTELVVSELVTNAIRYGRAPVQLRLIHDDTLICEVSDASSTSPYMRRALLSDEGGRGLLLVAQLTQKWGTRHARRGKTIWCEQDIKADRLACLASLALA
ncbi:SpoIIE family protein phosphatase [Streptomyces brasiliensis]|uniref:Uncharacterized protein n=1 Tax=Streptomyces brasiliensis TaxID=1954 RepID=A0A917L8A3_9ACTN|nr:SpoIIE family protein phosphatase [Streptomyces brasiliensis]GGJ44450.1 hypothetical protein GCM10010121_064560 [Streptomyces brasiliensis]